jgi:hypothetical protein
VETLTTATTKSPPTHGYEPTREAAMAVTVDGLSQQSKQFERRIGSDARNVPAGFPESSRLVVDSDEPYGSAPTPSVGPLR